MNCENVQPRLGELLDGELRDEERRTLERHLAECAHCRAEYESMRRLTAALSEPPAHDVPREQIWTAVERRLRGEARRRSRQRRFFLGGGPPPWRPLASAAVIVLAIGVGWLLLGGPWASTAVAGQIDFRPLLQRADGDIQAGIEALLRAHGGQKVSRTEAARRIRVRLAATDRLPHDLVLKSTYLLNLGGQHRALALHYGGPAGQLLLLQCPPGVRKNYGGRECLPCQIGSARGHITRVGRLRLAHFDSPNVCICIVSTLDERRDLPEVFEALRIDF